MGTDCLWKLRSDDGDAEVRWSQDRLGGKYRVQREPADGSKVTWIIDPDKGWNAEGLTAEWDDGKSRIETRCELARFGEVWFPQSVTVSFNGKRAETYVVHDVQVNQPDDPRAFTGNDIGLEPGLSRSTNRATSEPGAAATGLGREP
ncbi:MAG: hypothetical protein CHACPFDD_01052 [Phycisphaerae bacterium]|nr:hypothetical protein [Phycisphaerae bacterium]